MATVLGRPDLPEPSDTHPSFVPGRFNWVFFPLWPPCLLGFVFGQVVQVFVAILLEFHPCSLNRTFQALYWNVEEF